MSTASYEPNETYGSPSRLSPKTSATYSEEASGTLFAMPSSGFNLRNSNYRFDRSEVSDDDLITAAQGGDQHAFVELLRRYSALAKKKILRIVRNQEDAEDAFQDTLLRAYTHLAAFRRSCKFSTWFTTIGENSALMILRKKRVRRETYTLTSNQDTGVAEEWEHVDPSLGPEAIYLKQQAILLVRQEVQKLRPSLRSIVDHYYRSEDSLEESADALGISLGAAKSRLLRGRVRLRSALARYGVSNSCA